MRIIVIEEYDLQSSEALTELGHEVIVADAWSAMCKVKASKEKWDVVLIAIPAWITDTTPRDRFASLAVALRTASDSAKVVMCAEIVEGSSQGWSFYSDYDMLHDLFPPLSRDERRSADSRKVAFVYGGEGAETQPQAHQFYKKNWIALMACSGLFSTDDFNFPKKYVEKYGELMKP